jgi:hypothetical protein
LGTGCTFEVPQNSRRFINVYVSCRKLETSRLTTTDIEAFQNLCREEEVAMRIPVLSTVVVALALLTGAYLAAAQSSDEAAIA